MMEISSTFVSISYYSPTEDWMLALINILRYYFARYASMMQQPTCIQMVILRKSIFQLLIINSTNAIEVKSDWREGQRCMLFCLCRW